MTFSWQIKRWLAFIPFLLVSNSILGQPYTSNESDGELILVRLNIENKVSYDIDAYMVGENIFIPVPYIFDLLKIRYSAEAKGIRYTVEFPNENNPVFIDFKKSPKPPNDRNESREIIWADGDAYLAASFLEEKFEFKFTFDFRKMSLALSSRYNIPLIDELNRKNRYNYVDGNTKQNENSLFSDQQVESRRYLAKGLLADWNINNSISLEGESNISGRFGLGGQLLGGSINVNGSASKNYGMHWGSMQGNWTYPIHSTPLIQQIQIGDIQQAGNLESSMSGFRGFLISNRPNLRPVYFNDQIFKGGLQGDWDVEFYLNRNLVDYQLGDNQGHYNFTSPLLYGANHVQLKYYDAKGFHHQKQYLIQIPYDFLQPGKVEYDISAGEYSSLSGYTYARSNVRAGLTPNVTIGGGLFQSLNNPMDEQSYPYLQTWFRTGKRMLFTGNYMFNHLVSGSIRYTLPKSQTINFTFKKHEPNKVLNRSGKLHEISFNTSIPVDFSFFKFSTYINSRYVEYENSRQQLSINGGVSALLPLQLNFRINGRFKFTDENIERIKPEQSMIDMQLSRRLLKRVFLRTNVKYSHWHNDITNMGIKLDYRINSHTRFDVSMQRNNLFRTNQFMLRFRLDTPFARHTSSVRERSGAMTLSQNTTGSLLFNSQTGINFDNQRKIGRASLILNPFLDKNNNGIKDAGEQVLDEVSAKLIRESRHQELQTKNRFIENLVPYERYTVEVNPASLSDPFYQIKNTSSTIRVLPNMVNTLNIPVVVVGEVSGVVNNSQQTTDVNGLRIHITSKENRVSETTQTYTGGHYYFVGLMPGQYVATLDKQQLQDRALVAKKDSISFQVNSSQDGDIIKDINFMIRPSNETISDQRSDTLFAIQIGAFKEYKRAKAFTQEASEMTGESVEILFDEKDKLYKCIVGEYKFMEIAKDKLFEILRYYPSPFIITIEE